MPIMDPIRHSRRRRRPARPPSPLRIETEYNRTKTDVRAPDALAEGEGAGDRLSLPPVRRPAREGVV